MHVETANKFSAYKNDKQKKYSTLDQQGSFDVKPDQIPAELSLIRQTDEFLSRINLVPVKLESECVIGLGSGKLIAARVDTAHGGERRPRRMKPTVDMTYRCQQVNFDTQLSFGSLDAFAHYPDFNDRLEREIRKHINLDMIRLGFFGQAVGNDSDYEANPNGEDVAKGWIQKLRENRADAILTATGDNIQIGVGGDFETVNDAVIAVKNKIAPHYRDVNDLVVLLGSDLVAHDQANFYQKQVDAHQPVNQIELRQIKESYGAMPAFMPSCFPARGIMVTSFDNLSIYFLVNSFRRTFGSRNDRANCIDNFESVSIDYIIEHLDKAAAIDFETVQLKQGDVWQ
ncbi:P2 family phage major capsid protein [Vibrio furnissii]|uniref:P2 family phage major capsid protein n=1 Tax=Vibrio furnissii TaxID=29494 RepID=UPI0025731765|nr:P2 family phage major capsid protein [Vibrio furnissii]WJG20948.1 P2 family phage major capsid protein [Vibrio furnissii]